MGEEPKAEHRKTSINFAIHHEFCTSNFLAATKPIIPSLRYGLGVEAGLSGASASLGVKESGRRDTLYGCHRSGVGFGCSERDVKWSAAYQVKNPFAIPITQENHTQLDRPYVANSS